VKGHQSEFDESDDEIADLTHEESEDSEVEELSRDARREHCNAAAARAVSAPSRLIRPVSAVLKAFDSTSLGKRKREQAHSADITSRREQDDAALGIQEFTRLRVSSAAQIREGEEEDDDETVKKKIRIHSPKAKEEEEVSDRIKTGR